MYFDVTIKSCTFRRNPINETSSSILYFSIFGLEIKIEIQNRIGEIRLLYWI